MKRSQKNKTALSRVRSLLVTIILGGPLHAVELVGSSPLPAHFLYSNKLAEPGQPDPLRGCHELTPVIPGLILVIPAKAGIHTDSPPEPYCPVPPWPCHPREGRDPPLALDSRLRGNDDLRAWERAVGVLRQPPERGNELLEFYVPPEVLENTSNGLITRGAAVGDDGDKPPDGSSGSPDIEPQPDLTFISDPVQTCLQQKKQLLIILQIKRLWAIMTGQTTLARILSDRIMIIEADLLDLARSDPGTIQPGLLQTWLAENGQELRVYREMVSGKYSGRQMGSGKKNKSSRTTKASTTATTGQTGQTRGSAARNRGTGSTGFNGRGGDDPLKPSAEQHTGHSLVACSKCDRALNPQELERVANQTAASALLCTKCLSGIQGNKRVRRIREEAEPDSPEPAPKKKKEPGRKRKNSKAAANAPPAKKKKPPDTQIPDDPLEKVKANINYELSQEELKKVQTLLAVFKKKNITVKNTFYKLTGFVDRKSFNGFFDNAITFFEHLSINVKNTGMLTGMLKNRKKHIRSFAERSQDELEYLARLEVVTSFSSMNNGKGVPTHEQVKAILGWPEWKGRDGEFNTKLFRSFSSMNSGKGMLKHEQVKEVLGWPEWKDRAGEFSMELFRAFSSMNHSKGILKHEQVKEVLGWPEWKDKHGEFNMELFRSFSSLNNGKGVPTHEQVKEVLGWPEWKDKDGEFNIELFRAFSSMNSSKGMFKREEVKGVLGWSEWKDRAGEFSMELFRAFSSMNSGKGVLKKKEVKEVLGWPEWKDKHGEFNMELFRSFSSVNNGKGVPTHEQVKEVLGWPEWKDKDGEFNIELFRAFSSMNSSKGMIKHEEVKEVLAWSEWKDRAGEFSMELFRAFSSMNHGKGILKHEQVKEVLDWPEWRDKDGEFSMELFRSFSSMNNAKGILKHEQVKEVLSWSEWKDMHGEFNIELFRSFSSMNGSKGMLKQEEVKEVLGWPEWKDKDGEFSMELFRAFSSMNHGKGILKQEEVKEVQGWPEWKDKDGEFNIELFRAFSSMNSSKGMIKHEEVQKVLDWLEWKDKDGEFNMELFRAFSSMNSRKGMLKQKEVKEVLGWPEWKEKDGEFSMELFRAFSSMNSSKGMLKQEEVKEVLGWPEWKNRDGELNMELFRSFSSMNSGKSILKHEQVKDLLAWPEWKDKHDEFNIELFRAFSSMNSGKGMLKHEEVKEVLVWSEWKDKDGEFIMELFRSFSSMNHCKGMLKHEQVKEMLGWPEWKHKDGEFNMELFRAFSSMNNSRGMPKHESVKEVLGWPEWKHKDGEFNMELFRAFSSMNNSRGMLKHESVKEVLGWPEWKHKDGEFNMELFRAFSSMNNRRGMIKHEKVKEVLDWIGCRKVPNHRLLQIMSRLWVSAGLPAIKMLQHWETQLKQLLLTELTGEHSNPDNEGDDEYNSDSDDEEDKCNRQIKTVALYLSTPKPDWSLTWTVLKQFCQYHKETKTVLMLESLIGLLSSSGGKSVERYLQANQQDRHFLWRHSMKAVPFRVLNRAMFLCSCDEDRERFVFFVKRLKSLPDKRLWEQYSARLQPLSAVLKFDSMQRLYLEILQPLTKDDQLRFLDASHARVVFDLFPSLSALQKLSKEHSCHWLKKLLEACLQLKTHDITKEGIQILFEALLKTHSLLPWDHDIPDHFLSGMQTTDNNHVEIPVSGLIQSGQQLALSYIAVLMQNLNEMSFIVKGQWLEVEVSGDDVQTYRYPMPQLKIQSEKMEISNWSEEQFRTVLKITGISEHYYLTADQWQKLDNVQSRQAEAYQPENELETQKQAFGSLWLKLNQTEIFGSEILNLLEEYESEMELMHTVTLLKKAKIDSATHILEEWRQRACRKIEQLKKQDPLLSDVDPDVYQGCQELELLDGCGSIS
ncbi:hypothetical protein [Endozoicomonas sp. 8E]|uniref:hypothetical protein n=1 Tax=Endozoicomonas sp. 8E TaxID=3035692 RepID=UPI0029392384|nr:hypothetical protein [Endozoicomonas sp. 8E]WOG30266.1 hypothetical protein P6910_11675 [Endozoicomonas sp. 8E]